MDVEIGDGALRGAERDGIRVFKAVPYAAPPVGELRFAPPRPPEPWPGVRDATRFGPSAPQPGPSGVVGDENCLHLNIYAPAGGGPHPVFVWIHGGGAVIGSPNEYDGTMFARHGVVVVTVGYRLGVLGLLHLPEVFGGGNFSLLDQVAALRWVRDNIAAFGGDPERVTVGGESNGGRTVGTLLAAPAARGLFQRAIVQSGTGVGVVVGTPEEAATTADAVLAELGTDAGSLRDVPVRRIIEAQSAVSAASPIAVPYQVVVDGTTLPRRPIDAVAAGAARDVALLIGHNHDEQDLFAALAGVTGFRTDNSMTVDAATTAAATAAYRELLADWTDEQVRRHVVTSSEWWLPAIRFAEAHLAGGGRAWMYRLDWRIAPRGEGMGAPHTLDLPFVFGRVTPRLRAVLGRLDSDRAKAVTRAMHSEWIEFIADGEPGWPAYDRAERATFLFDDSCRVVSDPDVALRRVWDGRI
ncbi:carboxylesterase/lipase family protein [Saccharopolyspora taberi]|uniref:Carboxylesterase family protein n=1 Tax=Saccharopolyspora taberi TaxID=60895 RepID=A0ABN3VDQ0_9PSEU